MAQITCTKCSRELSRNAVKCSYCGQYSFKGSIKYVFALIYVILVTIMYYKWMRR